MQVIFLPPTWALLLCFVLWPLFQVAAALLCLNLPDRFFNPEGVFFRSYGWEKSGQRYDALFKVKRWKGLLPDGAAVWKKRGYQKKHLTNLTPDNLNRFLVESARGEMTHWLAILPFWVFGFFSPPPVIALMFLYALVVNLPCIIAQRYNRPRIRRLLKKVSIVYENFIP